MNAIVRHIITQIIEIIVNTETTTGTFTNGAEVTGISNIDEDITIGVTVSQGLATATITNDGGTLTVGDEAVVSGGAGSGARVQVQDITGAGVDEVIIIDDSVDLINKAKEIGFNTILCDNPNKIGNELERYNIYYDK